jgi:4-amino-4-deoxy-L-arabinose transferase-like glycosyltransferase
MQHVRFLFFNEKRLDVPLLGLFVLINLIVAINAFLHNPKIGYDAVHHLTYVQILSDRLPTSQDTPEFFSPPLPYVIPAVFDKVCEIIRDDEPHLPLLDGSHFIFSCRAFAGKTFQYLNLLLSIGTVYVVLLICDWIKPGNRFYKISTLALLSLLTVYYKTFSQVRGEPYVIFFLVVSIYLFLKLLETPSDRKNYFALGVSLGLLVLSRQWGFFIFPAILLTALWIFVQDLSRGTLLIKPLLISFILSALVGGWFYIRLYVQNGTFTAFNIENSQRLPVDEFLSVARKTRIKNFDLFKEPIRPNFKGELTPILYSDTWGDYWGFFTFIKEKSPYGDLGLGNSEEMGKYLGRVNFVSVLPTLFLAIGWLLAGLQIFNLKGPYSAEKTGLIFLFFVATLSIIGFAVFVMNYYALDDSTLKASYILQFFVALVFLGADLLDRIRAKSPLIHTLSLGILGLIFLHNLSAYITRYLALP